MIARRVAYLVANEYLGVNQGHPILDVSAAPRGAQVSGAGAARSRLNFQDQVPFGAQFVDARVEVWYKLPTAATTADDGELDEVESGCNSGDEEGKGGGEEEHKTTAVVERDSKTEEEGDTRDGGPRQVSAVPPPPPPTSIPLRRALSTDSDAAFDLGCSEYVCLQPQLHVLHMYPNASMCAAV